MKRTRRSNSSMRKDLALQLLSSESYLMVCKKLFETLGPELAVYISNLVDKYRYFQTREMLRGDDSFFLTNADQCDQLGLSEKQVRRCKRKVKEMGLITTSPHGIPPKEYYTIDWDQILRVVFGDNVPSLPNRAGTTLPNQVGSSLPNRAGLYKETKDKENRDNTLSPRSKKDDQMEEVFIPLAERLAKTVQSTKHIKVPRQRLMSWAHEVRKLHQVEGVSTDRIGAALDWYEDNIGGEYIPVIESGKALRDKFTRLEDAIQRSGAVTSKTRDIDPYDILKEEFPGRDMRQIFVDSCYEPAEAMLNGANKADLADALVDLHRDLCSTQDKHLSSKLRGLLPGPVDLISGYLQWIEDQGWLKHRDVKLFDMNHKLFGRYRREQACRDNLERDPLTGQSYLEG